MRLRISHLILVLVLLFVAFVALRAQQQPATPQQQPPTFRTGVRLVRVDVTATGRGDEPVADLRASDFDVVEDGIAQRIEQFQFVKLDGRRPVGDDTSLEIRTQDQAEAEAARDDVRVFALFLDDYHVDKSPAIMLPLRRALSSWVQSLWPTDLVAMMDPLTPLSALEFTRSRARMLDIINRFEGRQGEIFPVRSVMEEAQLMRNDVVRVRAEVTLSALASLVTHLGGLREGRKVVIFVSQGPPTFFGQGGGLQDQMQEIARAASRGNVTIYPLDPRGLGTAARGARDTMYQLAAESGGRVIANTNDASIGLSRVMRDTSAYYVLGYQPTRVEDDGRYHKISVRVKRPGVHVLAREGYWAPSGKEVETARMAAARTLEPGVAKAMETLAEQAPARRAADVWAGMTRASDGRTRLVVTWDPSDSAGGRLPRPSLLEVEVLDAKGGGVVEAARKVPGSDPTTTGRNSAEFLLNPGAAALRLTARSAADSVIDRWVVPILVPDFAAARLSLSTPRLYRARSLAELKAIAAASDAPPAAARRFGRSDRVVVALEWYGANGAAPALDAHLLTKDGRQLAELPLPNPTADSLRFELPIGSLGQGTYILRIRAKVGEATAEQLVAFTVAG